MSAAAIIFTTLFALLAMGAVAMMVSVFQGAAWQGSPLHLPVKSEDPEIIRHVHRASLPMLGALAFIALAHAAVLLVLLTSGSLSGAVVLALIVAGIVTTGGLAGVILAYAKQPHVKR